MKPNKNLYNSDFKVLWVDDDPAQEFNGVPLEATLEDIYGKQLAKARNYAEAAPIVGANKQIRLVLLDMEIQPVATEMQGQMIARELWKLNPFLKFIVLSGQGLEGRQMSLGEAGAKLMYIPKNDFFKHKEELRNLSSSWVDDDLNMNWTFTWDLEGGRLHLNNKRLAYEQAISITGNNALFLDACLHIPMRQVSRKDLCTHLGWQDKLGTPIEKTVADINKILRSKTNGRIWGIFTKAERGEIVTIVPNRNIVFAESQKRKKPAVVIRTTIESRVDKCEARLDALQDTLVKILETIKLNGATGLSVQKPPPPAKKK